MAPEISCYTTQGNNLLADCVLPDLVGAAGGEALFGILVGGTAMFVLWWAADGDAGVPATVAILSASLMLSVLPAQFRTIATTIMLLGLAAGIFAVAQRYFMSPAAR